MKVKVINIKLLTLLLFLSIQVSFITYLLSLDLEDIINYQSLITKVFYKLILILVSIIFVGMVFALLHTKVGVLSPRKLLSYLMLLVIVEVGLLLRLQQPLTHVHFFDEDIYLHIAQMINQQGVPSTCSFGIFERNQIVCYQYEQSIQESLNGYPIALAIVFNVFGANEKTAFYFNIAIGVLSIIIIYSIGKILWSETAGLFSAILLALFPLHIYWSVSVSPEILSIALILLGILFAIYFSKYESPPAKAGVSSNTSHKKLYLLTLSFLLISLAGFIRSGEYILLLISFIGIIIRYRKYLVDTIKNSCFSVYQIIIVAFFFGVNLILIGFIYPRYSNIHENVMFSLSYFINNFKLIFGFFTSRDDYLILLIIFTGIIGLYNLAKALPHIAVLIGLSVLSLFTLYTSYTVNYSQPNTSRFILVYISIFIIVSGIGIDVILKKITLKPRLFILAVILPILFVYIHLKIDGLIPLRDMVLNAEEQEKLKVQTQNPNCLFVTPVPSQDLFRGFNTIGYQLFDSEISNPRLTNQSCIVFIESFLCKEDLKEECQRILTNYKWQKLPSGGINASRFILQKTE